LKVFDLQQASLLKGLEDAYSRTLRLEELLGEARLMREQLRVGGDASAPSNGLALLALKSRVFSTAEGLPFETLDIQAPSIDALSPDRSAAEQIADLDALITALETGLEAESAYIKTQSETLLHGEGYEFLDLLSPALMGISGGANGVTGTEALSGTLSAYIAQRYEDLFDLGEIALSATSVATDTPLFAEIQTLYPELFAKDPWKELSESVPKETELGLLANEMAQELLNMQGLEALLSYSILDTPLSEEIARRESTVRSYQADIARLNQVKTDLQQRRDLAWEAYSALLSTAQEINITSASASSEVRFASPALAPRQPVGPGRLMVTAVGMAAGLMLGVFGAFLFDYIGMQSTPRYVWGQIAQIGHGVAGAVGRRSPGEAAPASEGEPPSENDLK